MRSRFAHAKLIRSSRDCDKQHGWYFVGLFIEWLANASLLNKKHVHAELTLSSRDHSNLTPVQTTYFLLATRLNKMFCSANPHIADPAETRHIINSQKQSQTRTQIRNKPQATLSNALTCAMTRGGPPKFSWRELSVLRLLLSVCGIVQERNRTTFALPSSSLILVPPNNQTCAPSRLSCTWLGDHLWTVESQFARLRTCREKGLLARRWYVGVCVCVFVSRLLDDYLWLGLQCTSCS